MKIWKFTIPPPNEYQLSTVSMPEGAEVITLMGNSIVAKVDTTKPVQPYAFRVVKTDEEFNDEGTKYTGSFMLKLSKVGEKEEYRAFHVFQVI